LSLQSALGVMAVKRDGKSLFMKEEVSGDTKKLLQKLSWLWKPICSKIQKGQDLYILSHDVLSLVPYAALSDQGIYIVDNHAITVLPSLSIVSFLYSNMSIKKEANNALCLALSKYESSDLPAHKITQ
jgi:CHAT domain-containing protein